MEELPGDEPSGDLTRRTIEKWRRGGITFLQPADRMTVATLALREKGEVNAVSAADDHVEPASLGLGGGLATPGLRDCPLEIAAQIVQHRFRYRLRPMAAQPFGEFGTVDVLPLRDTTGEIGQIVDVHAREAVAGRRRAVF